jgi:cephalosporin-C deacetylase-like acetyl esterase
MEKNQLLKRIIAILLPVFLLSRTIPVAGQEENLLLFDRWIEWTDGKNMLVHHLNQQAFRYLDMRDKEIAGLKTREDWVMRQAKVKDILFNKIAGPFPEKTLLNAKVTGIIKKEGYKIEKIVYESMPDFFVTGCLYIPDGKGKKPAILFTSGHTQESFRYPSYQVVILNLVKKGFIIFAIDPVSQGERVQVYDSQKNASAIGPTTREHGYLGNQCIINGVSLARYFIWDGIRAIDYLLTRKEVDPARLGVTGQSGGGTQSAYIFACDDRIKAGAPVNYITGFRRLLESIGPQDAEQNFYHVVSNGITHADLLELRAPNPALIVAGTRDFFSIQGARESYDEIKNAYKAFGTVDNISIVEDDFGHGYTKKLREGIYAFFQKSLNQPGNPNDEDVTMSDPGELKITTTGNVANSFENCETVFSINKKETQKLTAKLQASRVQTDQHLENVKSKAIELSGYMKPNSDLKPVFRGRYQREGYSVEMYALNGEGNCKIPLLLFVPASGSKFPGVIYLHPNGKAADSGVGGKMEELARKGYLVAAPDLIGTGETSGSGSVAMLIGRSTAGIQAGDIVRVADFLKSRNDVDISKIGAIAYNEMGSVLIHAAAFDNSITAVSLIGSLLSYKLMALNMFYNTGFNNNAVAGALTAYDLPDLIACIAPRKIALVDLNDQMQQSAEAGLLDDELKFPKLVYSQKNVPKNIYILPAVTDLASLMAWCYK